MSDDVPLTLPYDPVAAKSLVEQVMRMERGGRTLIRLNPSVLDRHFDLGGSRPITVRWAERKHIFSDRVLRERPELVVRTLLQPREIRENREGERRRKRPPQRAIFYGPADDEHDIAVVVEFLSGERQHHVVTAFSPTKARIMVRHRNEPVVIWRKVDG